MKYRQESYNFIHIRWDSVQCCLTWHPASTATSDFFAASTGTEATAVEHATVGMHGPHMHVEWSTLLYTVTIMSHTGRKGVQSTGTEWMGN
jgi:hypothetical protein